LSVAVRWGPVRTGVNGTLVARPARTTFVGAWQSGHQLDRRVRIDSGEPASLASREAARQVRTDLVVTKLGCLDRSTYLLAA
jgi:hypothetical protein